MSRFSVDTDALKNAAGRCGDISNNIGHLAGQIRDVKYELDFDLGRYGGVMRALDTCIQNSTTCKTRVSWYSIYGENIAGKYEAAENQITGNVSAGNSGQPNGGSGGNNGQQSGGVQFDLAKFIRECVFGGAGTTGSIFKTIYDGISGKTGKAISDILKLVGNVAKNTSGSKINWGDIFKLTKEYTGHPFKDQLGKYFDFSTAGKGIASACNWAANIISAGYDNYLEFKDNGGFQSAAFWGETAAETLLNIGEGIVIGGGVTAVAALAGITAGTVGGAVVIGAAAAGVTVAVDYGLDLAVQAIWGTDVGWKEFIADGAGHLAESVADTAQKAGKAIGDAANAVGNAIGDAANAVGNAVGSAANAVGNAVSNAFGSLCNWGKMAFA
jgi:hypothetical protein